MSLARKIPSYDRSSTARALPEIDRAPRPATKPAPRRSPLSLYVVGGFGWLCLMAFAFLLVHQNSLIADESRAITKARQELAALQAENRERESRLVQQVSVPQVEQWAMARGMKRATTFQPMSADPAAVVARPAPAPPQAQAAAASSSPGFWSSVRSYLSRLGGGGSQSAAGQ